MVVGIGIDMVAIERLDALLHRRPAVLMRWFHVAEVDSLGTGPERVARLAARFAAKEALIKACGGLHGGRLRDIALIRRPGQAARLEVEGPLGQWLVRQRLQSWVSVTHERQFATAMVVLERRFRGGARHVARS